MTEKNICADVVRNIEIPLYTVSVVHAHLTNKNKYYALLKKSKQKKKQKQKNSSHKITTKKETHTVYLK